MSLKPSGSYSSEEESGNEDGVEDGGFFNNVAFGMKPLD
jgi:hypothetical protein